jgi:hypothetical protein
MSRFLSRLFTAHHEEAFLINIKVYEVELITTCKMEGLYIEWVRGDTTETSGKIGFINTIKNVLSCNEQFSKLSIFYKNATAETDTYLEKKSTIKVFATSGDIQGKYPMLMGEA